MELRILAYIPRRLPYASLGLYTLAISTPTTIAMQKSLLARGPPCRLTLINWMLDFAENVHLESSFCVFEDVVLLKLLIEPDNVRYATCALLLLKKTEQEIGTTCLLQEAERLGLRSQIAAMFQFLETHTQTKEHALPIWNEFVTKAREYKVIIE